MSEHSQPAIYAKIAAVMNDIGAVGKSQRNAAQGFNFRGIDDVYNALHPIMAKHGVFSVPEILEERRIDKPTRSGGISTHVILRLRYQFFAQDGSSISATVIGEAADSGDKASTKAMAIAHKYALVQVFAIPTQETIDPDGDTVEFGNPNVKSPQKPQEKKPTEKKPVQAAGTPAKPQGSAAAVKQPAPTVETLMKIRQQRQAVWSVEQVQKYMGLAYEVGHSSELKPDQIAEMARVMVDHPGDMALGLLAHKQAALAKRAEMDETMPATWDVEEVPWE